MLEKPKKVRTIRPAYSSRAMPLERITRATVPTYPWLAFSKKRLNGRNNQPPKILSSTLEKRSFGAS
ncbi:hypothetical protein D3C78_1847640 [compost metagenome]